MNDNIDMMDMYYPDTSDEECASFVIPPPPDTFRPSWARNGHGVRIEPSATVVYIATYARSSFTPSSPLVIRRSLHNHPKMKQGVVQAIDHAEQTVMVESETVPIDWDLVVGRVDAQHQSIPLTLYGLDTNDTALVPGFIHFWTRRTLDFQPLTRDMAGVRSAYIQRILGLPAIRPATLASVALRALEDAVAARAAAARTSFFAAADEMVL